MVGIQILSMLVIKEKLECAHRLQYLSSIKHWFKQHTHKLLYNIMMATSLFTVIWTYLLLEVSSVEILSTKVDLPVINDTEGVTKMICLLKNVHKTKKEVIGACASLGNVCSLEGYRNDSTNRKHLGCNCLQNVIHNIDQVISHSPGKFKAK